MGAVFCGAGALAKDIPSDLDSGSTRDGTSTHVRWADLADTLFRNYSEGDGLPQRAVMTIAQDGAGFLWIGTQAGLARWDGYRFRVYLHDPNDPDSLPDSNVHTLHVDKKGRIWIGTPSSGLILYDNENDRFISYSANKGLPDADIQSIADDDGAGIWVATDNGLCDVKDDGIVTRLRHDEADPYSIPDDHIRTLLRDDNGRLWIGTLKGLALRDIGDTRFVSIELPSTQGKNSTAVNALFKASDGRLWIGTDKQGVYVFDPEKKQLQPLRFGNLREGFSIDGSVSAILEARKGLMWIGTNRHGIVAFDSQTQRAKLIGHDPVIPMSLPHDNVNALFKDASGLVWVGSFGGISRHDPGQAVALTLFAPSSRENGLSDTDVRAILSVGEDRAWLSTHGIDTLDAYAGRVANLAPSAAADAAVVNSATSFAADSLGNIYIGTTSGLYRSTSDGKDLSRVSVAGGQAISIKALLRTARICGSARRLESFA